MLTRLQDRTLTAKSVNRESLSPVSEIIELRKI